MSKNKHTTNTPLCSTTVVIMLGQSRINSWLLSIVSVLSFIIIVDSFSSYSQPAPFGETTKNVATQILQGTGASRVDLNKYNLANLEEIEQQWTAKLVQKVGQLDPVAVLGAKNAQELFVDTLQVSFPRRRGGLGLELLELAGGREDGLGITVISGIVEGGSASVTEENEIMVGDSIAQVSIVRQERRGSTSDLEEELVVQTECLNWDATVAAIQSLPPPADGDVDEYYALTLKRLRRKPKVKVKLQYPPSQNEPDVELELFAGENLRHGMLVRGVKLNDPLAKRFDTKNGGNCGAGGLCRTCSVAVQSGSDLLNPQRLAEKQMLADNPRWRLACKAIVGHGMQEGDMTIRVNPRQW